MSTLFSFAFTALFLSFIVAAIVGHALLIEALVRPFFSRWAIASRAALTKNSMLPRPAL